MGNCCAVPRRETDEKVEDFYARRRDSLPPGMRAVIRYRFEKVQAEKKGQQTAPADASIRIP